LQGAHRTGGGDAWPASQVHLWRDEQLITTVALDVLGSFTFDNLRPAVTSCL
jgi:hypothetical protein